METNLEWQKADQLPGNAAGGDDNGAGANFGGGGYVPSLPCKQKTKLIRLYTQSVCCLLYVAYTEIIDKNHVEVGGFLSLKDPVFSMPWLHLLFCFFFK